MEKYQGTKQLQAKPMTLGEYNTYRRWAMHSSEDPNAEGYFVEYLDHEKPNDDRHAGYISWSPKDVFEKSYKLIETPLDRLLIEYAELTDKLTMLVEFLDRPDATVLVGSFQFSLMLEQKDIMKNYTQILGMRIELLKRKFKK